MPRRPRRAGSRRGPAARPSPRRPAPRDRSGGRAPDPAVRAASPPRGACGARRRSAASSEASWARSRPARARCRSSRGVASATASSDSAASADPACCLVCAAARARRPRCAASRVSRADSSRNAAAAARPPRVCARSAERSSSSATASSGSAVACARCQARRSGSTAWIGRLGQRAVGVASLRRRGRSVDRGPHQRMVEPHPAGEIHESGLDRGPRRIDVHAEPGGRPPHEHRITDRLGRRHQQQPPGRGRKRLQTAEEAVLDPPVRPGAWGRANPPASSSGVRHRGSSSSASGFPWVSATMRSRTRSSIGPVTADCSRARASSSSSPWIASSGRPASGWSPPGSRTAKTSATDSATRRRATKASACREASSSHCASSTTHTQRLRLGGVGEQASTRPGRRGTGPGHRPRPRPNAVPSASR